MRLGAVRWGRVRLGMVGLERGCQRHNTAADCQGATPWAVIGVGPGRVRCGEARSGMSEGTNGATA